MVNLAKPLRYLGDVQNARNSHKKAQRGTKREARAYAGTAFWSAGLLPRIVAPGIMQAPALPVISREAVPAGLDGGSPTPHPYLLDSKPLELP